MPNYITNVIKASAEVLDTLKNTVEEDGETYNLAVDFDKVVERPRVIEEVGMVSMGEIGEAEGLIHKHSEEELRQMIEEGGENLNGTLRCVRAAVEAGYIWWYPWAVDNWGTKWNACDSERLSPEEVKFDTAWSMPEPIIKKLSEKFPNHRITIKWADEDIGHNCGEQVWMNGEVVEDNPPADPIRFALNIKGWLKEFLDEGYVKEDVNGVLVYAEEDEEE